MKQLQLLLAVIAVCKLSQVVSSGFACRKRGSISAKAWKSRRVEVERIHPGLLGIEGRHGDLTVEECQILLIQFSLRHISSMISIVENYAKRKAEILT
ncbi:hypothetical protein Fmac_031480 [Flemingia macrophylla]|uniref:Secreted protein n=1 Tax=Flemingia macrophylla TaxID=520843 RepID=A0ABD1L273_9FABA